VDHTEGVVYDYKTRKGLDERSGFETFEPSDRYVDQLTVYQYLAGMEWGQLVYVAKHDWAAVKQAPDCFSDDERRFFRYDGDRLQSVLERAHDVRDAILQDGFPSGPSEVPFDRCGCWVCENEDLRRDWILGDLDADFHTGTLRDALIRHRSSAGLSTDLEDAPERGDTEGSA
jgi:CRISPR-associated exonuclease Cas4